MSAHALPRNLAEFADTGMIGLLPELCRQGEEKDRQTNFWKGQKNEGGGLVLQDQRVRRSDCATLCCVAGL